VTRRAGAPLLLALAAGLALADASIVTLALPSVIAELDTTVEGAAAVIGVYTAVLALAAWAAGRATLPPGAGPAALAVFALACIGCGAAPSAELLIALRGLQAAAAGVALIALVAALRGTRPRWWTTAATLGIALGPALGGVLTELFDWRAIFLAQAPVLAAAAYVLHRERPAVLTPEAPGPPAPAAVHAALALVAAALTAVLFLLVLLLVSGWSLSPLEAAVVVSVLPLAAAAADLTRAGDDRTRAALGAALIGAGTLALASLPGDDLRWVVVAQVAAGAGMGLALPALNGRLLPERTRREAARLLTVRHAGITVALALLAPIASAQLDDAVTHTREQGAALVLDAELPPLEKVGFAGALVAEVDPVDPRGQLRDALDENAGRFEDPAEQRAFEELRQRADVTLVQAVDEAFRLVFVITGVLALLAAVLLRPHPALLATLLLPAALALLRPEPAYAPVTIQNPCQERALPGTGGISGALQDAALLALDRAACRFGSSREELAIALADTKAAEAFEREHGVDPRSLGALLEGIAGF
jgi:hypothetical protein